MIKKTAFAAAPEESRLTINGVLFEHKEGRLRLVATDNKRMAIAERKVAGDADEFSVSVPQEFLKGILKLSTKDVSGKPAVLGVTKTKIFFRLPGAVIYASILQGNYPPYEEGLGIKLSYSIECSVSELLNTIRRAMLVNPALAAFVFTNGKLTLSGASASVGSGDAAMAVDLELPDDVESVRVGFNPRFYRDALEAMTAKKCRFYFQGPKNAGVLKEVFVQGEGDEAREVVSGGYVYAVMPALLPR